MFDIGSFGLSDVLQCGSSIRALGQTATCMEEVADEVVRYLYDHLVDKATDTRALGLVRLYKTHRYEALDDHAKAFARTAAGGDDLDGVTCLTLLGTAGDEPEWNDRTRSRGHQALPLRSASTIGALPMVARLVQQFGLEPHEILEPDYSLFRRLEAAEFGVFYVEEAAGSPFIPAQDFVAEHGIRSALGFGGVLPSGFVFAVVMFSKVPITPKTADAFSSVAFAVNLALLPFVEAKVFRTDPVTEPPAGRELRIARAEATALARLLDLRQEVVLDQALRLERAVEMAEERAEALVRSQANLAESEARKAATLDAALDCIISMDGEGRVVEFNPAAEATFGYRKNDVLGARLADLIIPEEYRDRHAAGLAHYLATGEGPILGKQIPEIPALRSDGTEFPAELAVTPIVTESGVMFTGFLRDITERKQHTADLERIAKTLQESLLPPSAPEVPGLDIAFSYEWAGGTDVGGDFYDVFQLGKNDWVVVLGDVMGKGTEAATLTALTRNTVRAAAMTTKSPARMLAMLNSAVHRQYPDRFCTAVLARMRLESNSVRMVVASGGHLPVVVRSDAHPARSLPARGLLLGPFPSWDGREKRHTLHAGDHAVFYSDGVTEARRGNEEFGVERLLAAVDEAGAVDAGGLIAAIRAAVADFSDQVGDDMAIVVVRTTPA